MKTSGRLGPRLVEPVSLRTTPALSRAQPAPLCVSAHLQGIGGPVQTRMAMVPKICSSVQPEPMTWCSHRSL